MSILDIVLPPACAGCGRSSAGLLCGTCRGCLHLPSEPIDRFVVADSGVIVGERLCLALAAYAYAGPMRRALAALKYGGAWRMASVLADLALPTLHRLAEVTGDAVLVHVPVHADRRAARGYDQAELLAQAIGRRTQRQAAAALARTRATTKQHRLDRAARLGNLRGAFVCIGRAPTVAILVDDIITTTATLEACAGVLRDAGCEAVYGLAIAREV